MDHIPDSEDIPPMPLVSTVCDSGTFSLADAGGYSGMGGRAKFTNWRTKLLPSFFCRDSRARSCLGIIVPVARCYVKPASLQGRG